MSDFTSEFWDIYIAIASIASIVACAVFLKSQSARRAPDTGGKEAPTTGHIWDEDLAEYNNPLPLWWSWLFYITIAFSLVYLVLYPGLGSWPGMLGWTQVGQLRDEQARAAALYGPLYDKFAATDVETLTKDPEAMAVGQSLFLNTCAQCHASDGAGSRGFPNLTNRDWLWGGDAKSIKATIADGRTGVMPPFGAALGADGAKDVTHYVFSLSNRAHDSIRRARGEPLFKANCVACHGADGKGNPALGAPNLADRIWLHGSAEPVIIDTIMRGRTNHMPAHKEVLNESKIHILTAYVMWLSRRE